MERDLLRQRREEDQVREVDLQARRRGGGLLLCVELHHQTLLATRHREVALGEEAGIEQRAVHGAVGIVHEVALAQRIERVLPAGMQLACKGQRIGDLGDVLRELAEPGAAELEIQELDVELGVMDDQLGAGDEIQELLRHLGEFRLGAQVFERHAVYPGRAQVDVALGVEVSVELPLADVAREDLYTADFDDAVAELGVEAGGFGIKDYLARHSLESLYSPERLRAHFPDARRGRAPSATLPHVGRRARRAFSRDRYSSPVFCPRCASRAASSRGSRSRCPFERTSSRYTCASRSGA